MRSFFLGIFICSACFGKSYTLNKIITITQERNIKAELAKTDILALESEIDYEKSHYFPELKAVTGVETADAPGNDAISGSNFLAEARLEYEIFQFGRTSKKLSALGELRRNKIDLFEHSKVEVSRNVKKDFFQALYFQEVFKILEKELNSNKALRRQVRFRRKQGLVGKADVLEMDMRRASLKSRLLEVKEALAFYKNKLRQRAFLEESAEFELKGNLPHEHFEVKLDDLLKASAIFNRGYKALKARTRSNAYKVEAEKTLKLPSLKLRARYGQMRIDEKYSDNSMEGLAGIYLEIPLFDGGAKNAKIAARKAELAKESLKLKAMKKSLRIEVSQKLRRLESIHERVDLAESNVKSGEKYFNEVSEEYKRGVKNSVDLAGARDRFLEFKIDLLKSKKDFIITKLELEEVAGVTLD
ncbi:MAG: hypothetical protein CME67_06860 [Halobacteriovoraceae bacterium]|nr:hypothetical protein [Halobacteriovoraceae bacterium]|tara:strand:+ start:4947 stop:6194 length:1248 start_codon:yes stop_codon:yes gene_type:complete